MAEKPPAFVVVDKRKFTAEGEIREGFVAPPEEPRVEPPSVESRLEPATPEQPEFSSAKIVTMPARTPEAARDRTSAADDLRDEDMAGTIEAFPSPAYDADGLSTASDSTGLDGDELVGEPRSAAETEAQHAAYRQSTREIDALLEEANPGMQSPGQVAFEHVIQSFYLSAIMAMGAGTEPGQKPRIDILGARQSIDMLNVLEEKTRGNLSAQEQQLLQGITFELRMMFLELTNAISKQAHQPGAMPPPPGSLR